MEPSYMTSPRSPVACTPLHMFLSVDAKNLYQESDNDDSSSSSTRSHEAVSDMGCPRSPTSFLLSMFNSTNGRTMDQTCRHASSPYHNRIGKYLKKMKWGKKHSETNGDTVEGRTTQSQENMEASYMRSARSSSSSLLSMFNLADGRINEHDHKCEYASDSYHRFDETCTQDAGDQGKRWSNLPKGPVVNEGRTEQSGMSTPKFSASWLLSMLSSADGNNVQKKCENASNPYHECTEICTQMKDAGKKGSKGLKSVLGATIHDSRDIGDIPKSPRNVHPQCKYVDSPYHNRCTQTCMQRISEGYKQSKGEAPVDEKPAQSNHQEFSSSPHKNLEDPLVKSTPGASSIAINASDPNKSCTETKKQWEEDQSVVIEYDKWIEKMKGSLEPGLMENFLVESPEVRIVEQYEPPLPFTKLVATDEENVNLLCIKVEEEKSVIKEAEGETADSGQSELQPKFVDGESDCDCTEKCIEEEEEGSGSFGKSTNNDQNNKGSDPESLHAHLFLLLSIILFVTLVQSKAWSLWQFRKHERLEDEGENK